ncbi:MAG: hypothetical protein ABEN55_14490, partial [Bradymonadaceae bacterium]
MTTAGRALDRVEAFVSEFDQIEERVPEARREVQSLAADCENYVNHIGQRTGCDGIAAELRELVDATVEEFRTLRKQIDDHEINALRARERLTPLRATLEFLFGELETDLDAFDNADSWADSLGDDIATLERPSDLSPAIGEVLDQIAQRVDALRAGTDDGVGGGELLARTRTVARGVGRARELAHGHLHTAAAARRLQAEAHSRLERVDGRAYGFGVRADCQTARQDLAEADAAVESGDDATALSLFAAALFAA